METKTPVSPPKEEQQNGRDETTKTVQNPLSLVTSVFSIKGKSPLLIHRFTEKAAKMIEDKQQGKSNKATGRKKRDPEQEWQDAKYMFADGKREGIRAISFKKAMVRGGKQFPNFTMTDLKGYFHVLGNEGDILEITGKSRKRTDAVKLSSGVSDMRYRPEYPEWSVELPIEYNENVITEEQLIALLMTAGFSCGVGEMRPERGDNFGRFEVVGVKQITN